MNNVFISLQIIESYLCLEEVLMGRGGRVWGGGCHEGGFLIFPIQVGHTRYNWLPSRSIWMDPSFTLPSSSILSHNFLAIIARHRIVAILLQQKQSPDWKRHRHVMYVPSRPQSSTYTRTPSLQTQTRHSSLTFRICFSRSRRLHSVVVSACIQPYLGHFFLVNLCTKSVCILVGTVYSWKMYICHPWPSTRWQVIYEYI